MVNSIAGRYRDMVSMSPVPNLTADKMKTVWTNAMKLLTEIGFDPVTTITDGLSVNMKFFKSFGESNSIPRFIPNPSAPEKRNYPMCDTVHLLKNLYGNLMNYGTFVCPTFDGTNSEIEASFDHVVQVYNLELSMPIKLAHKLTDKVLDPSTLEKTNVQLANSFFHESTINALRYYANHGHPEFKGTADVLQIIRNWFNTVNVRSEFEGQSSLVRALREIFEGLIGSSVCSIAGTG